jgi:hypothetical protein
VALEVTVGPPVLTINNGHTFLVSELDGSITPASDQGLYSAVTPRKLTWSIPWSSPKRVSLLREPWAFS